MMGVFAAFGLAMWVAACATQDSQDLSFSTLQLPTNASEVAATEAYGHFIVDVGQVAIVLSTDFVPG